MNDFSCHPTDNNNNQPRDKSACASSVVDVKQVDSVPEKLGRTNNNSEKDGRKLWRKQFHIDQERLRKTPGHCVRCGKPHVGEVKQCDACRDYMKRYKARKFNQENPVDSMTIRKLTRRIESLEMAVAKMQVENRKNYKAAYGKGYRCAQRHERKLSYREMETISMQELATINHAYDNRER